MTTSSATSVSTAPGVTAASGVTAAAGVATATAAVAPSRRARVTTILLAGLGAFLALGTVGLLASTTGQAWILGSFGASCILLFGFPKAPFSQTRNVIGGHVLSSAIGLALLSLLGPSWWGMAAAGAMAAMAMMATDTVHPPAGSNPIIIFLAQPGWDFLVMPTLLGACALVLISQVYRRIAQRPRAA